MNPHRGRRRFLALAIGALVAMPFAPSASAANQTVYEKGTQFQLAQVEIKVGESVTWVYVSSPSGSGHSVTFEDASQNGDRFTRCPTFLNLSDDCQRTPSDRFVHTFNQAGRFPYYCKVHEASGMRGVVIVDALTSSSTTTTTSLSRSSSTTTTARATSSSTTSTTRQLATSSTVLRSSTTTSDTSSALVPGAPPSLSGDSNSAAGGGSGGSGGGSDRGVETLIVGLLLAVSAGGGYLLWRLRPGRS